MTDIDGLGQARALPTDPAREAQPVSATAARVADDERRFYSSRQLLASAYDRVICPQKMGDRCTTGHWKIDRDTGGLRPGFVWIFGAETNWGKTAFLVSVTDENLALKKRVLNVVVEDPPELYGTRLLTRRAKLDGRRAEMGSLYKDEVERAIAAANSGTREPVLLDARDRSVEWAAKKTRECILDENIDLVMFDYLHAFDSEKPGHKATDRRLQVNYIARTLTNVVKSTNRAGIIFAQITCEDGKRPTKYSIRDSRDVSNAAEVVALGWTPDRDQKSSSDDSEVIVQAGKRCIIVDKNKAGPNKRLYPAKWNKNGAYFEKVDDPDEPPDYIPAQHETSTWYEAER